MSGDQKAPVAKKARWKPGRAALVVLGVSCLLAYWLGSNTRFVPATTEGVVAANSALCFGEVWEDSNFRWALPIQNRTGKDVMIAAFFTSCNCSSVTPKSLTIPAGKTEAVELSIDTAIAKDTEAASRVPFEVTVTPQFLGKAPSRTGWKVYGQVKRALKIDPRSVVIEGDVVRGGAFPKREITLATLVPLDELSVRCDPKKGSAQLVDGAKGQAKRVVLTLHEGLPVGKVKFNLEVQYVVARDKKRHGIAIPVEGRVVEDVQAIPNAVLLGPKRVGDVAEGQVVLRSIGSKAFRVSKVETDSAETVVGPGRKEEGSPAVAFSIQQKIAQPGYQSRDVRFVIASGERTYLVPMTVSYYGELAKEPTR